MTAIASNYLREELKDRKLVETEITESVVNRIQNWTKLVLYPATGLLAILTVILTVLGVDTFQRFKDLRETVIAAKNDVTNTSEQLKKAQGVLDAAQQSVKDAQEQIRTKRSEIDRATSDAISGLRADSLRAHTKIDQLQQEWSVVGEENPYEQFTVSEEDNNGRVATGPRGDNVDGVTGYLLLKKTPLPQSIQVYVNNQRLLPRWTYKQQKNVLIIGLRRSSGDPIKGVYFQVGYVADKGADVTFHQLVKRNGLVFGDGTTELQRFEQPRQD
ncbi:MAG: hypothetical protein WBE72_25145 [Terracidiphilus sp.]